MTQEDNSNKTIEELAREAMDAIKKSEIINKNREEIDARNEAIAKENALKEEVKRKIKKKMRLLEKEEAKKPKEDEVDPRFVVNWKNIDKKGLSYDGYHNEVYTFKITRGLYLYHLNVVDNKLMIEGWQRSTCTSSDLFTLKEKADKILRDAISRADDLKKNK